MKKIPPKIPPKKLKGRQYPKRPGVNAWKKRGKIKPAFTAGFRGFSWKYPGTGI